MKVKFDQLTDTVTSLTQKLTEITKLNKDLKSQIGDLRKSVIKTGRAKQQTLAAVEIQEPSRPKVSVNNNTSVNVETSNMFSVLSGVENDQLTQRTVPSHLSTRPLQTTQIPAMTRPSSVTTQRLQSPPPSPHHTDRNARTRDSPPPSAP